MNATTQFLTPALRDDEEEVERSLRPRRLDEFVGQARLKEQLSIALDAANPSLQYWVDNHTRTQQFGTRLKTYLDGPSGQAMYQRFFAATVGPDKLGAACQLYDFAGYSQGYFVSMWGLTSSIYADDIAPTIARRGRPPGRGHAGSASAAKAFPPSGRRTRRPPRRPPAPPP